MKMNWYCTDLDEDGYFKLHLEVGTSYAWKRIRMTEQFWFEVRALIGMLKVPRGGLTIVVRSYV